MLLLYEHTNYKLHRPTVEGGMTKARWKDPPLDEELQGCHMAQFPPLLTSILTLRF